MIKIRKQSTTTYPINFLMVDSTDHITAKTGLTVTVTLSKNGAAFGAAAGAVTEISNGWYSLAGNATDRNTLGELLVHASATGADPTDMQYAIVEYDPFADIDAIKDQTDLIPAAPAPASEYDSELAAIQADLDNPNQYKADVSALALEATLTAIKGAGWTDETLVAIDVLIDAIKAKTDTITPSAGAGAIEWPYNLKDNLGAPIADANIWVTTDEEGTHVIASGRTDQYGNAKFWLDTGTVYVWGQKTGYDFSNPDTEVVS